ncbi:MAG: hypothetical protein ABIV07_02715 [Polaromonas sp.]
MTSSNQLDIGNTLSLKQCLAALLALVSAPGTGRDRLEPVPADKGQKCRIALRTPPFWRSR